MSTVTFSPPFHSPNQVAEQLRGHGYAVLQPRDVATWLNCDLEALQALSVEWDDLRPDEYLKDGGSYRYRRHASFVVRGEQLELVEHRPHWQPLKYNALHGGMERWFAPVKAQVGAVEI